MRGGWKRSRGLGTAAPAPMRGQRRTNSATAPVSYSTVLARPLVALALNPVEWVGSDDPSGTARGSTKLLASGDRNMHGLIVARDREAELCRGFKGVNRNGADAGTVVDSPGDQHDRLACRQVSIREWSSTRVEVNP
jgi:hypothetical protein